MGRSLGDGLKNYYKTKIEELEIQARDKQHNLRRLEAQRNELNTKGTVHSSLSFHGGEHCDVLEIKHLPASLRAAVRLLREELQLLQEPGSYVGEVVKVIVERNYQQGAWTVWVVLKHCYIPWLAGHGKEQGACQGPP